MDVTQATTSPAPTKSNSDPADGSASVISSDFETFLLMLTAQLENQDPLNPIESTDYAVQLATFSSVEQQVLTNDLLVSITDRMGADNISQLAGWVGMEARVAAPVSFDGAALTLVPPVAEGADQAFLVVRDQFGRQVQRSQIDLSGDPIQWAGVDPDGDPFASGVYQFNVESYGAGVLISDKMAESYAEIIEAKNDPGGVVLVLAGGSEVTGQQITALRKPN